MSSHNFAQPMQETEDPTFCAQFRCSRRGGRCCAENTGHHHALLQIGHTRDVSDGVCGDCGLADRPREVIHVSTQNHAPSHLFRRDQRQYDWSIVSGAMFWREGSKNCWCALPLADLEPQAVFLLAHLMVNPKSLLLTLILLWCSDTPLEKSSFRKWRHSWKVYVTTKVLRRLQQDASCLPHIPTCGIPNHYIQRSCSNARGTEHVLAHSSPSFLKSIQIARRNPTSLVNDAVQSIVQKAGQLPMS